MAAEKATMRRHAFISYVREDKAAVDRIQRLLEAVAINVWRDTNDLWPGEDWRIKIRQAIQNDSLVFIACFSDRSVNREKSYQNEELRLAVEQLRLRRPDQPWLIPVRLSDCSLPLFDLGEGKSLDALQRLDLFGDHWDEGSSRLIAGVYRILASLDHGSSPTRPALNVAPFYFEGELAYLPSDLGRIFSEHWQAACQVLTGATKANKDVHARLYTWLDDHAENRALRILNEPGPPGRRLTRLIAVLAPSLPPRYDGHDLDQTGLVQLAERGGIGDTDATRAIAEIFEFDILGLYPMLAEVNASWRRVVSTYNASLPSSPEWVATAHRESKEALSLALLGCLVGFEPIAVLVREAVTPDALSVTWFRDHIDRVGSAPGKEQIPMAVATIVLAHSATGVAHRRQDEADLATRVVDSYWAWRQRGHIGIDPVARELGLSLSEVTRILNSSRGLLEERTPPGMA
jgi:hypothetical protein